MQREFHESAPVPKAGPLSAQLWRVQRVQKVQAFQKNFSENPQNNVTPYPATRAGHDSHHITPEPVLGQPKPVLSQVEGDREIYSHLAIYVSIIHIYDEHFMNHDAKIVPFQLRRTSSELLPLPL